MGLTQADLARAAGVTQTTVSNAETGRNASSREVAAYAAALRCNALWLADGIGPEEPLQVKDGGAGGTGYIAVRRGSLRLMAGVTGYAVEYENHDAPPIFFRSSWIESRGFSPERLIALKVAGASMEPGLYDCDTVVVNLADAIPRDGEVYAVNYEGELVIKRLRRDAGEWWIASDNPDKRRYGDKRISDDVQILGRIVYKSSEVI